MKNKARFKRIWPQIGNKQFRIFCGTFAANTAVMSNSLCIRNDRKNEPDFSQLNIYQQKCIQGFWGDFYETFNTICKYNYW